MERQVFPREERLKNSREISAVFTQGGSVSCGGAKLFFKRNALERSRIAFVFSRKFGTAVERNRARRLGREAYRHLRGQMERGWDIVFLVYPDARANFKTRRAQLAALIKRARI